MGKGVLCREAEFVSLYGVPQHVTILEIKPERHRFDILIHSPKEETSNAARRSGAVVAINGSYFNIKQGTSICYLRKDRGGGGYYCDRCTQYCIQWCRENR